MSSPKTFTVSSFLKAKGDEPPASHDAPPLEAPPAHIVSQPAEASTSSLEAPPPDDITRDAHTVDLTSTLPAPAEPLQIAGSPAAAIKSPVEEEARKKPGPKPRDYIKRSIGVATDLDAFVEEARRTHIRPDGTRSTLYSHFVEDLIAAELDRRRSR